MDPQERKQGILEAAKQVFAEKGYHDAGVADIIQKANIARGTFYLYFKSKHQVFTALVENIVESIRSILVPPTFDQEDAILLCLKDNLERVKNFFMNDPDLLRIFTNERTALDLDSRERLGELQVQLVALMSDLVKQAQNREILRPLNPDIVAYAFFGSLKELFENQMMSGYLEAESDQITSTLLDLYMFGLITPAYQIKAQTELDKAKQQEDGKTPQEN